MHANRRQRSLRTTCSLIVLAAAVGACGGNDESAVVADERPAAPDTVPAVAAGEPAVGTLGPELAPGDSWYWQLQGVPEPPFVHDVYDLDLFETTPETVAALHADDRVLICYFSAGSFEDWRPDAAQFADADLGETLDGWEDERWLDIRSDLVRAIMTARLDRARDLGCDAVEPDNVTAHHNETGFDLTADDQLDFNRFLASEAHARGLSIGLKNDLEQIPQLVAVFDFAVNEQCHEYDECAVYVPFVEAGKPVFNAEYADRFVEDSDGACADARSLGISTIVVPLDLDGSFHIACPAPA